MPLRRLALLIACLLPLTACQAWNRATFELARTMDNIKKPSPKAKIEDPLTAADRENCPAIGIEPGAGELHQFNDPARPMDAQLVSAMKIDKVDGHCRVNSTNAVVDIEIQMTGSLGPSARHWKNEKPSFAYPYNLSIIDGNGAVVSREVFAATVSYSAKDMSLKKTENIHQLIPLNKKHRLADYKLMVGFELTKEERMYNDQHKVTPLMPMSLTQKDRE